MTADEIIRWAASQLIQMRSEQTRSATRSRAERGLVCESAATTPGNSRLANISNEFDKISNEDNDTMPNRNYMKLKDKMSLKEKETFILNTLEKKFAKRKSYKKSSQVRALENILAKMPPIEDDEEQSEGDNNEAETRMLNLVEGFNKTNSRNTTIFDEAILRNTEGKSIAKVRTVIAIESLIPASEPNTHFELVYDGNNVFIIECQKQVSKKKSRQRHKPRQ